MTDVRKLIGDFAAKERAAREVPFLAPCVPGGRVRARLDGLIQTYRPIPQDFEGWGIFLAQGCDAVLQHEADLPLIDAYQQLLMPIRFRLAYHLRGQSWLAYPMNVGDVRQRIGAARPMVVHLVTDGTQFDPIIVRGNRSAWRFSAWWFAEIDRRADPQDAEFLRDSFRRAVMPSDLRYKGLTPEMGSVYVLATTQTPKFSAQRQQEHDQSRLTNALGLGGGSLLNYQSQGDFWLLDWMTSDGARHTSAISKSDLTVLSSGICLSDRDRDFDLQSLVGVIERRTSDWED